MKVNTSNRVACFLCRCRGAISDVLDLASMRVALMQNPKVASVEVFDSLCLPEDLERLAYRIKSAAGERILIVACSHLARGNVVVSGLQQRGIDPAVVELVDIREGCAWIHQDNPGGARRKARALIHMGIAALFNKNRSDEVTVSVKQEALVVGAGPAGLAAAASLGRLGFVTHLVERSATFGGLLKQVSMVAPENTSTKKMLSSYLKTVALSELIHCHPSSSIAGVEGAAGNFKVTVSGSESDQIILHVGAIIIATGAQVVLPHHLYRYADLKGVLSAFELEKQFRQGPIQARRVVFIQCVAARDETRRYCSGICCPVSLKNAVNIRKQSAATDVFILHRDIMCPGNRLENLYRHAMSQGVHFIRYDAKNPPKIEGSDQVQAVIAYDVTAGHERRIDADLVVLSTPLASRKDTASLSQMIGLKQNHEGFFDTRPLMHPLETSVSGVFVCGSARWPVLAGEAILQGEAAAIKALGLLSKKQLLASQLSQFTDGKFAHARVDREACSGCGNCAAVCPYDACSLEKVAKAYISVVNAVRCSGCGSCTAVCPNGSIQLPEHNTPMINQMIKEAFA